MGYSRVLVILSIIVSTTLLGLPLILLYKYVKSHWGQPLQQSHSLHLLGFWVWIQVVLLTHIHIDFYYHHQWKIITVNYPLNDWYRLRCFRPDYPPLWNYIEMLEGYFLGIFFPQDLRPGSVLFETFSFKFAAGLLNIALNSTFWFALLKIIRTIERVYS